MGNRVTLTKEMVDAGQSCRGGFNREQLAAIGVKWPLQTGWRRRLVGSSVTREEYERFLSLRKTEPIERIERGWGGHFSGGLKCRFRRNTLLTMGDVRIVVSTVGLYEPNQDGKFKTLDSSGNYFETMAFFSDPEDIRYHDADVSKPVDVHTDDRISEIDADDDANDMHEAVVDEIIERIKRGEFEGERNGNR